MPLTVTEQKELDSLEQELSLSPEEQKELTSLELELGGVQPGPIPEEVAFERAGKVWDAAIEFDVPTQVADQYFYDPSVPVDPDDFTAPIPDNRVGFSEEFIDQWTTKGITKIPVIGGVFGIGQAAETILAANRLVDPSFNYDTLNERRSMSARRAGGIFGSASPNIPVVSFVSRDSDRRVIAEAFKRFEREQRGLTFGGKVARGISQLPTWMVEFAATGGLAALGDDAARIAGEKLLRNYAKTTAGKVAIKSAGLVTGAVTRTSTGLLPRVGEKAVNRQALVELGVAQEEGWATSLSKAWGDTVIESFSEETGRFITKGIAGLAGKLPFGNKFIPRLRDDWMALTGGTADNFATRMLTKGGYSSILGEMGEERLGTLLREITGVSDREGNVGQRVWNGMLEDLKLENLGSEFVTLLAPASVRRGMTIGVSLTEGVTVPTEAEQLQQATDAGTVQFDTPEDAQGFADKAKTVAERTGDDVKITVDDKSVTIEKPLEAKQEGGFVVSEFRHKSGKLAGIHKEINVTDENGDEFILRLIFKPDGSFSHASLVHPEGGSSRVSLGKFFGDKANNQEGARELTLDDDLSNTELQADILDRAGDLEAKQEGVVEVSGTKTSPVKPDGGTVEQFEALGNQQRGKPESAMLDATSHHSGAWSWLLEHVGDLTHRMTENLTGTGGTLTGDGGFGASKPKIERAFNFLTEGQFGRSIEEAHEQNIVNNAKISKQTDAEFRATLKENGEKYAQEHAKLPVFNEVQQRSRDAAIALGKQDFETATEHITWLKNLVDQGEDAWNKAALENITQPPTEAKPAPKVIPPDVKAKQALKPNESITPVEKQIAEEDPIFKIKAALARAIEVQPITKAEQKTELKKRVGAAAGALRSNLKKGTPTDEAIFKSTGLLKGELTDYEQRFESIEDQLTTEEKNAAYDKINNHPDLKYFEVVNTATSFRKLLAGTALTDGDVKNIERVFGKTFSKITIERVPVSSVFDRAVTLWKAGLLTGLKTQGLNALSNMVHSVTETAKDIPASLVDTAASLFTGERSLVFTTKGTKAGIIKGIKDGWIYLRTGYSERDIGKKLDYRAVNFGTSKIGRGLQAYEETIFHLLGAADQPFYYGAKARSIFSQAIAQGKNKGLKGKELDSFVEKMAKNPTDDMLEAAVHDAEVAVFQNRTGFGDLAKLIQKAKFGPVPIGEIIVPFGRTPSAVATQIINYTPVGAVKEVAEQISKGVFNQRQFAQATGRAALGTGSLYLGGKLLEAGLLTLDRPRNERERRLWELEGRAANSIKIDGKWRSIQVLGPVGNTLIIGGHFTHQLEQEGSPTIAIAKALAGSAKSFSEQTFVRGVNQAVSALVNPERSFENWFSSMAGSAVPTIVADIARAQDEIQRRTGSPAKRVISRVPGLRETLPPKINVFGQDLPRYGGNVLEVMADPSRPSKIRNDVVVDELRRLADNKVEVTPTLLGDRDGFDILTDEENTELWRRLGELTYKVVQALINTDQYKNLNDFDKGKQIEEKVGKTRAAIKMEAAVIKMKQGVPLIDLAESGLLTFEGVEAFKFFGGGE